MRDSGVNTPIVAIGSFAAANIPAMVAAGVNGFALSLEDIMPDADPVKAIDGVLSAISAATAKDN